MPRLPALVCAALALTLPLGSAPEAADRPPVTQAELDTWWSSAGEWTLGKTSYQADHVQFEDGVCKASLDEGVLVPIYTGRKPVSERIVGVAFVGKGTLQMRIPSRGDAYAFASRRVQEGDERAAVASIANQEQPFSTEITRAVFLSADPKIQKLLLELMPYKAGAYFTEAAEGEVATYVVTDAKRRVGAEMVTVNMVPNRRHLLEKTGLDPAAILRQDRLLNEEFGFAPDQLRLIADFKTTTRFGVAALDGATFGPMDYDEWLTCFRDGLDQSDLGFKTMAFSHGVDTDGIRHFQRWSGEAFERPTGAAGVEPARWMAPVHAETDVTLQSAVFGSVAASQKVTVSSTLTLEARGGPMQSVTLRLPTAGALADTWELTALTDDQGRPIAWAGLTADLSGKSLTARKGAATAAESNVETQATAVSNAKTEGSGTAVTSSAASDADASLDAAESGTNPAEGALPQVDRSESETDLVKKTETRIEIIALLPEAVPVGGRVTLKLAWKATWPYANWSSEGRPLGPTTGVQEILPELIPSPGGTAWDFTTRLTLPMSGFRTFGVALSGDTVSDVTNDEDGWRTIEARGTAAMGPAVAIGRWYELAEESAKGLPGVRVSLFTSEGWALPMFPPEVRRVVTYLERFLPDFPNDEVEVFQGKDTFVANAMGARRSPPAGLVSVQQVKVSDVGQATPIEEEDPHYTQTMIARQIAAQYWGQRLAPATSRDAWMTAALADAYAAFYVRAAFGKEDYAKRVAGVRRSLEQPVERSYNYKQVTRPDRFMSLSGSTVLTDVSSKVLQDYAFYVVAEMLRFQVGDQDFFRALDRLATRRMGQRVTTEMLQAAMEETSEQDLSDFFDYWVHGGLVPELAARVQVTGDNDARSVSGVICSSVPFGTVSVPLVVTDQKGKRSVQAFVRVVDGEGRFTLDGRQGDPKVEIDPDGFILAYGRKVQEVREAPTCAGLIGKASERN